MLLWLLRPGRPRLLLLAGKRSGCRGVADRRLRLVHLIVQRSRHLQPVSVNIPMHIEPTHICRYRSVELVWPRCYQWIFKVRWRFELIHAGGVVSLGLDEQIARERWDWWRWPRIVYA